MKNREIVVLCFFSSNNHQNKETRLFHVDQCTNNKTCTYVKYVRTCSVTKVFMLGTLISIADVYTI